MRLLRILSIVAMGLTGGLGSGCATLPTPQAVANGERLSIRDGTELSQYETSEKVGEVQHRDSSGHTIGSSDIYENRLHTVQRYVWRAYQGNLRISDDDLYRIAQDEPASLEVQSIRESGVLINRIGLGTIVLGVVASGLSYFAIGHDRPMLGIGLSVGGLLTASVGGLLAYFGLQEASNEHPLEQSRAIQAADNYNRRLSGAATGVDYGR